MTVFQIKGQSHRLSTLKYKEKDVIKIFSTYGTKYTEDTEALGRQLSQAKDQSPIQSTVYELLIYRCAYDVHNYDAQQLQQSWSNNLPSYSLDNHHSSDVVCWRGGGR